MDLLRAVTEADLAEWERVGPQDTWVGYWAHRECWSPHERRGQPTGSYFMLPTGQVPAPRVLADGQLTVWVDTAEGWLWAALPKEPERWLSRRVPEWVRHTPSPWYYSGTKDRTIHDPALVRRRLTEGEAPALLEHIMPPVNAYEGLPAEWAQTLRLGGWYPRDVTVMHALGLPLGERRVWWKIEGLPDIQALAQKLPARWKHERWPLDRKTGDSPGEGPLARHLATLLAESIPPETVAAHRAQGRALDTETLRQSTNPVIPDNATRVRLVSAGGVPYFALNAESARRQLARQTTRAHEVYAESVPGLVPLHVDANGHFVVWSDGLVHTSAEVYQPDAPHIGGTWAPKYQRLLAARSLMFSCTRAENWGDLQQARVWETWLDAEGVDSTVVHKSVSAAHGAERTITLTRHVVALSGGKQTDLWEVAAELRAPIPGRPRQHTLHTTEKEARAALDATDDGLPPVMTIAELAPYLGTTKDALRKALRRERLKRYEPYEIDSAVQTVSAEPGWRGQVGRYTEAEEPENPRAAHLYDPRVVKAWWTNRPGHGPGRGHRS